MFIVLKIEGLVIYHFPILVLGLIFDRGGTSLVEFFISQYDFGLGCERDFCSFSREEIYCIYMYICIYIYIYIYIYVYIIYKHAEWVRPPSKKCSVCITCQGVFFGLTTFRICVVGSEYPYITCFYKPRKYVTTTSLQSKV